MQQAIAPEDNLFLNHFANFLDPSRELFKNPVPNLDDRFLQASAILEANPSINTELCDEKNRNILHFATYYNANHDLLEKFLCSYDPHKIMNMLCQKDNDGKTPLMYCIEMSKGNPDKNNLKTLLRFVDFYKQKYDQNIFDRIHVGDLFRSAVHSTDTETVEHLISLGASPNIPDSSGNSALHNAIYLNENGSEDRFNMLKYLIDSQQCNINQTNRDGNNPIHLLANLLDLSTDISSQKIAKSSYIKKIYKLFNLTQIPVYFQYGEEPESISNFFKTNQVYKLTEIPASFQSAENPELSSNHFIGLAKKTTTCINQPNNLGNTPMHIACQNHNLDLIKLLYLSLASFNCQNHENKTPYHLFAQNIRPLEFRNNNVLKDNTSLCQNFIAHNTEEEFKQLLDNSGNTAQNIIITRFATEHLPPPLLPMQNLPIAPMQTLPIVPMPVPPPLAPAQSRARPLRYPASIFPMHAQPPAQASNLAQSVPMPIPPPLAPDLPPAPNPDLPPAPNPAPDQDFQRNIRGRYQ